MVRSVLIFATVFSWSSIRSSSTNGDHIELESSCTYLADGKHWIQPMKPMAAGSDEQGEHPSVFATCSQGWTIIDLAQDSGFESYFSSIRRWTDFAAGPQLHDLIPWDEWWQPADEGTKYRVSPDCATCDDSSDYSSYYMTGNYVGCLWETKGYCDMDPVSLECYTCNSPGLEPDEVLSGLCSHMELAADTAVSHEHESCVISGDFAFPSIGTNGQYCVCYRPEVSTVYPIEAPILAPDQMSWDNGPNSKVSEEEGQGKGAQDAAEGHLHTYELYAEDFQSGTYRIMKPGLYKLMEDIELDMNPQHDYWPVASQESVYPGATSAWVQVEPDADETVNVDFVGPYSLGFFAGVAIEASDVVLDLNGHELKMSRTFAMKQRWFALVEIGNKPFISGQGPANFGFQFIASDNVVIKNGILGRTSHHGIHGNGVTNLVIRELQIKDFEVGGIQLNGFTNILIEQVEIGPSCTDVPVYGTFSQSRHILPRVRAGARLNPEGTITFPGRDKEAWTLSELADELEDELDLVHSFYMHGKRPHVMSSDYPRFTRAIASYWNDYKIPTYSTLYGILLNSQGATVFGVGLATGTSSQAEISNVQVHGLRNMPREVPQIPMNKDPLNGIFDITRVARVPLTSGATISSLGGSREVEDLRDLAEAQYVGTALSDAQYALNRLVSSWDILGHSSITDPVVAWVEGGEALLSALTQNDENDENNENDAETSENDDDDDGVQLRCNNDVMLHLTKGVFGLRIDNVEDVSISDVTVQSLHNLGALGSELCGAYTGGRDGGHPIQNDDYELGYTGTEVHALSVVGCTGSLDNVHVADIVSARGDAHGLRLLGDNEMEVGTGIVVRNVHAGAGLSESELGALTKAWDERGEGGMLPNKLPRACGISAWRGDEKESSLHLGSDALFERTCFTSHRSCGTVNEAEIAGDIGECGGLSDVPADVKAEQVLQTLSEKDAFHRLSYSILKKQEVFGKDDNTVARMANMGLVGMGSGTQNGMEVGARNNGQNVDIVGTKGGKGGASYTVMWTSVGVMSFVLIAMFAYAQCWAQLGQKPNGCGCERRGCGRSKKNEANSTSYKTYETFGEDVKPLVTARV